MPAGCGPSPDECWKINTSFVDGACPWGWVGRKANETLTGPRCSLMCRTPFYYCSTCNRAIYDDVVFLLRRRPIQLRRTLHSAPGTGLDHYYCRWSIEMSFDIRKYTHILRPLHQRVIPVPVIITLLEYCLPGSSESNCRVIIVISIIHHRSNGSRSILITTEKILKLILKVIAVIDKHIILHITYILLI